MPDGSTLAPLALSPRDPRHAVLDDHARAVERGLARELRRRPSELALARRLGIDVVMAPEAIAAGSSIGWSTSRCRGRDYVVIGGATPEHPQHAGMFLAAVAAIEMGRRGAVFVERGDRVHAMIVAALLLGRHGLSFAAPTLSEEATWELLAKVHDARLLQLERAAA